MMVAGMFIGKSYKKGTIHIIESLLSSFILLIIFIYFISDTSQRASLHNNYEVLEKEGDIFIGNTSYLFISHKIGIMRHIVNKDHFLFNSSEFPYAYVIDNGNIIEVFPFFDSKGNEAYYSLYRYVNDTYVEVFFRCLTCTYDILLLPKPLEKVVLQYIIFYNNETAYVVIE